MVNLNRNEYLNQEVSKLNKERNPNAPFRNMVSDTLEAVSELAQTVRYGAGTMKNISIVGYINSASFVDDAIFEAINNSNQSTEGGA